MALLKSRQKPKEPGPSPFDSGRLTKLFPPGVEASGSGIAQDNALTQAMGWAAASYGDYALDEGIAFLGYPYLASLAQRAEFRKIVDVVATEMTRKWVRITAWGEDDKTDRIKAIEDALERLRARDVFRKAAEHDGFFGRSHIFVSLKGDDVVNERQSSIGDGRDATALGKVGRGGLVGLVNVEPYWIAANPIGFNTTNPLAPDFYRPGNWSVLGEQVHASRLLTFIGRPVPDVLKPSYAFGGLSMTQMAKPYVDNWLKTRESVSDLISSFAVMGVKKMNFADALANGEVEDLFNRIEVFNNLRDNRGFMALNGEEEFFCVATPLGTLDKLQAQAQEQMASICGIPLVKLLGVQPAGLNACLPGDTLIHTDRGQVPIRDVTLADRVMTRRGYAPLTFSGVTKHAKELIEIRTESRTLLCTGNHPIWLSSTNEFVPAENVRVGDRLLLIGAKPDTQKMRHPSHGEGSGGGSARTDTTQLGAATRSGRFSSIARYGRRIAGRSLTGITSIMSMRTRRTIDSPIWSRCILRTIWFTIASSVAQYRLLALNPSLASTADHRLLLKGFQAERNSALTRAPWQPVEWPVRQWPFRARHAPVQPAAPLLWQSAETQSSARDGAPPPARTGLHTCAITIWRILTSSAVRLAERIAPLFEASHAHARDAVFRSLRPVERTSFTAPNPAKTEPDNADTGIVLSVRTVPADEWVYDLSVAEGHLPEFYANSILTHNSSEGEIRVFYDYIHAYQERLFAPALKKLLGFVMLSEFGEIDEAIGFEFEPLWQMSELERADVALKRAQAVMTAEAALAPATVLRELREMSEPTGVFGQITDEDIEEAEAIAPMPETDPNAAEPLPDRPEDVPVLPQAAE